MNIETIDGRLGSEGGMCKWMLRPPAREIDTWIQRFSTASRVIVAQIRTS
jgi:hypothetical protein